LKPRGAAHHPFFRAILDVIVGEFFSENPVEIWRGCEMSKFLGWLWGAPASEHFLSFQGRNQGLWILVPSKM
jgi:hypothetical protein